MAIKNFVPLTKVSAESVQDLINQMRGESEIETTTDLSTGETGVNPNHVTDENKKSIVPKAIVSVDPEIQRMRELLTSGREAVIDSDGTISAVGELKSDEAPKAKTVPKAVVSA